MKNNTLALSFAQESFWMLHQMEPHNTAYNDVLVLRLHGELKINILEESLNRLLQRHEILRTTYFLTEDGPRQQIAPFRRMILPVKEVSAIHAVGNENEGLDFALAQCYRSFDLLHGPVFRFGLVRFTSEHFLFYFSACHIVFDGWSKNIILKELSLIYNALRQGVAPNLPEVVPYIEYIHWQNNWVKSENYQQNRVFWKQQFEGGLPQLNMPLDHPRPRQSKRIGRRYSFNIPSQTVAKIHDVCKRHRLSLFNFLAAAYHILLARYTAQNEISVGCVFSTRWHVDMPVNFRNTVGAFVNTLPLYINLKDNPTVRQVLIRTKDNLIDALQSQAYPYYHLVAEIRQNDRYNNNTGLNARINMQGFSNAFYEIENLKIEEVFIDEPGSYTDILFEIAEESENLVCAIRYDLELFETETIVHFTENLQNIIDLMLLDEEASVNSLQIIPAKERQRILDFNPPASNYPSTCLHDLIQSQADSFPQLVAASCNGDQITYQELTRRADVLARRLYSFLNNTKAIIAFYLPRGIDLLVAQLAILKAGSAYLPLDITYPKERTRFMLEDAKPALILTLSSKLTEIPAGFPVLCLDNDLPESVDSPLPKTTADDLAYVLYTSGSTGQPKGSLIYHRGAVNYIEDMIHSRNLKPAEKVLNFTSFSFDPSVRSSLGVLAFGGTILLMDDDKMRSPSEILLSAIIEQKTQVIVSVVPTMLRALSDFAIEIGAFDHELRLIMVSGEVLTVSDVQKARLAFGANIEIVNQYGPTECSMITTTFNVPEEIPSEWAGVPIGMPIRNTQVYILDSHLQLVPCGVIGEICIGGAGVGGGYLNHPELTAEKFVKNPFSSSAQENIYRTGDLGKNLQDGTILYLGRMDAQVKFHGHRVELGEIENVLKKHLGIREAVVLLENENEPNVLMVAYLTLISGSTAPSDIREYLAQYLPNYMIPSIFIAVEKFPLTLNHKIDRIALSQTPINIPEKKYVPPSNEIEEKLMKIWKQIMKLEKISVTDNFFDLGGHSLAAVKIVALIEKKFPQKISLVTLLNAPTIRQQAEILLTEKIKQNNPIIVPVQKGSDAQPPLFCLTGKGGNPMRFFNLIKYLSKDQPVYYFRSEGLLLGENINSSVEGIALNYVQEVKKIYPLGPYFFLGESGGGLVAYEMAQRLHQFGDEIGFLGLLDTFVWAYMHQAKTAVPYWLIIFRKHLQTLISGGLGGLWMYVAYYIGLWRYKIYRLKTRLDKQWMQFRYQNIMQTSELVEVANIKANRSYIPQHYPGSVHFFHAALQAKYENNTNHNGWDELALTGLTTHSLECYHGNLLFEPFIRKVAQILNQELRNNNSRKNMKAV